MSTWRNLNRQMWLGRLRITGTSGRTTTIYALRLNNWPIYLADCTVNHARKEYRIERWLGVHLDEPVPDQWFTTYEEMLSAIVEKFLDHLNYTDRLDRASGMQLER